MHFPNLLRVRRSGLFYRHELRLARSAPNQFSLLIVELQRCLTRYHRHVVKARRTSGSMRSALAAAATRSACLVPMSKRKATKNSTIALADFQRRLADSSSATRAAKAQTPTGEGFIGTSRSRAGLTFFAGTGHELPKVLYRRATLLRRNP